MLTGDTDNFLYSLPIVMACSLVASRIVSMTFIPLLGYYILRPGHEMPIEERRKTGFGAHYYAVGMWCIEHRWKVLVGSLGVLVLGGVIFTRLDQQFFPADEFYLSYADVWLPEDAPVVASDEVAQKAEKIIRDEFDKMSKEKGQAVLTRLTTFVGGGGPRFWFSVSPELQTPNYAQILIEVADKHDTAEAVPRLQQALSENVAGARIDVRQLETGKAVGVPVAVRLSGPDLGILKEIGSRVKEIFIREPLCTRVRDDWGEDALVVKLDTNTDKANMSGVSNYDVASASVTGVTGSQVGVLRQADKLIPIVATLRMEERGQLGDLRSMYVYSSQSNVRVPITQVAEINYGLQTSRIARRNQFRTMTIGAFPVDGVLPSVVMNKLRDKIDAIKKTLPNGYILEVGGEEEDQIKGFGELILVMAISVVMIYLALVFQFKNAIKPFIVFAAIPYGITGALWIMRQPFGFMAFLGVVSLIGVIVSHIIVLFDFIEEAHERGESLIVSLLDAGVLRLRPVLITVGATVIALFPLAAHGGPLWQPMCYAQAGGLTAATVITLLLVPVFYSIAVLDLKIVHWEGEIGGGSTTAKDAA